MREFPTFATAVGDPCYDDKLTDESFAAIERRKVHQRDWVKQLERIDRARLGADDQLNYDLSLRDARLDVEEQRFPGELLALTQLRGVHAMLAELALRIPRRTAADLEHFLTRMHAYPKAVDDNLALLRRGLERGVTAPQVTLVHVGELIANHLVDDPAKSPIYQSAFAELPESIPPAERTRLQAAAKKAIAEDVVPPLRRFHKFVVDEYVPHARKTIGASALPDGAAWYALAARRSTTTDLPPERIHQIGLDEVARIRREMERVMQKTGW